MGKGEEMSSIDFIKIIRKYKCKGDNYDKGDGL